MQESSRQPIQKNAYKLVFWQIIVVIMLAVILFFIQGFQNGISALVGGLAYAVPNLIFVWRVFRYASARSAKKFLVAFFAGELFKLLFSAFLFILAVKFLPVKMETMLMGFATAIIAFWIISFYFLSRDQGVTP